MPDLGPQQFDIPISDQLFPTLNPDDPAIGIAPSALVPVTIPWNLQRTELAKDQAVTFGTIRWSGAGTGPHDVFAEKLGGQREKIGTVSWSIDTVCYQTVQSNGGHHRWLITPCPILSRTFTPLSGAPETTEAARNPQPCPGNWVNTPPEVAAALAHAQRQPAVPVPVAFLKAISRPAAVRKSPPRKKTP